MGNIVTCFVAAALVATSFFYAWSAVKEKEDGKGFRITYMVLSFLLALLAVVVTGFIRR